MPCNLIRTSAINLAKVDETTLAKTLAGLGFQVQTSYGRIVFRDRHGYSGNLEGGRLTFDSLLSLPNGQPLTENLVKQAYGSQVVKQASLKYGWRLKEQSPGQFLATKQG